MSFAAVLHALQTKLEPVPKLVLVAIASFANHETGRCDPKIRTVAKYASVSVRTVHRMLRVLEADRVIITINNFQGKARLPSSYAFPRAFPKKPALSGTRGCDIGVTTNNHNLNQTIIKPVTRDVVRRPPTIRSENVRDQACQVELARRLDSKSGLGWEMLMESEDQLGGLCAKLKLGTLTASDLEEVRQRYRLRFLGK
jgi:hypothetical protein